MTREQIAEGYMVFGGIPYYWDVLSPDMGLAQNVDRLLFSGRGELANEYEHLYASLFRKPAPYVSIIRALGTRRRGLTREEIGRQTGLPLNGDGTVNIIEYIAWLIKEVNGNGDEPGEAAAN